MFNKQPVQTATFFDIMDGDKYASMTHTCQRCGKQLKGVLEIADHGLRSWQGLDPMFSSEDRPTNFPFICGCRSLYNTAMFVKLTSMCKETSQ